MKRAFISFADSRMISSLNRIQRQAEEMNFFDEITVFTEKNLDADFLDKNAHIMKPFIRGFGFWVWKPYIILQALKRLNVGDELYYIDAGCHLNSKGKQRMQEYAEILKKNKLGIAGFELGRSCSEKAYTKMDLIIEMGAENNEEILASGQICAGHIFCIKTPEVVDFINEWMSYWQDIHMIDDTPSHAPNFPEFIEHRHDQSVFSILCKQHGAARLPGNETWPTNNSRDWSTMKDFPIWDKRDLGWTSHLFTRFFRKVKKTFRRIVKV